MSLTPTTTTRSAAATSHELERTPGHTTSGLLALRLPHARIVKALQRHPLAGQEIEKDARAPGAPDRRATADCQRRQRAAKRVVAELSGPVRL
ncbi:hypothetical protein ACTMU2_21995 [Cupriavidus basilensis]